jgi:hypothetical protein
VLLAILSQKCGGHIMFERISRFFAGATKQERAEPSVSIPEPVTLEGDNAPSAIEHDRKIVHDSRVFIHRSLGFILMVYSPELFRKAINHDICLGYIYGYIIAAIGDDEELCKHRKIVDGMLSLPIIEVYWIIQLKLTMRKL